jgi:hypothetical protein
LDDDYLAWIFTLEADPLLIRRRFSQAAFFIYAEIS